MTDTMISSIVSAVVGALVGGIISLLVSMQRSRAEAATEKEKATAAFALEKEKAAAAQALAKEQAESQIRAVREQADAEIKSWREKFEREQADKIAEARRVAMMEAAPLLATILGRVKASDGSPLLDPNELLISWSRQQKMLYFDLANLRLDHDAVTKIGDLVQKYLETLGRYYAGEVTLDKVNRLRLKTRDQIVALMAPPEPVAAAAANHTVHAE